MRKIDTNKFIKAEEILTAKYGEKGTESRTNFNNKAMAYYYGTILKDIRKELNMTQEEIAKAMGVARSYVARVEKGETDIQLSSFFRMATALGVEVTLKYKKIRSPLQLLKEVK